MTRDLRHVVALLRGDPCPHRKWGVVYDTYATVKDWWEIRLFGRGWYPRLWGCLYTCDMCGTRFLRWPGWEPPNPHGAGK